ncbi:MAG: hypothetical protein CM15mP49_32980 [Actinomycetota bacterium]|nr:MAG: hypothetical protein CM15mP49_32980 [Actinomycetota bacterium]
MNSKIRLLAALVSSLVIVPFALSCGGSSNSDLETSLRSQLSATQAQLDQAQELITNLQDQIESLENTIQTPVPEPVMEEAEATEEAAEETPEVSDAEAEAILTAEYQWLVQSDDTARLQELLGIEADGWYGNGTRAAHITALENLELPVTNVPDIPCGVQDEITKEIGEIESESDTIEIDLDGDGSSDQVRVVTIADRKYITAETSYNGNSVWKEFGEWGSYSASEVAVTPEFGTDVNQDGSNELWLKINPLTGPAGGAKEHYVYVFQDCELQVMNDTEATPYDFYRGNTVSGETFYIDCVIEDGEALLVYHEDYRIGEPGDFVWAYVPTALRLTGTTFEEVISSSFEDDISPAPDPLPTDNCPKTS